MKILIVTQYFWPENFRINDFATALIEKGHDVTVLTGIPNYPAGRFYDGYGLFKHKKESFNEIKIIRALLFSRGKSKGFRLFLNYISFAFFASIAGIFRVKGYFDIIFVYQTSPITVGIPAIIIKKIKKRPICFWVLDLWPESVFAAGNIKSQFIYKMLLPLIRYIYKHSDKILIQSKGFISSIKDKGVDEEKLIYFPSWAESIFKPVVKVDTQYSKLLPDGFRVMFAGNIGEAQDFKSILEAAKILKNKTDIHWMILGDGRKKEWVEKQVREKGLDKTFHLLGAFPLESMPIFYSLANTMLVSLKKNAIFSLTIPGKIQSYLACGKPILAMLDGEGARVIQEAMAGLTCNAGNSEGLARNILEMYKMKKEDFKGMGKNARRYYERHFDRSLLLQKAENIFESLSKR